MAVLVEKSVVMTTSTQPNSGNGSTSRSLSGLDGLIKWLEDRSFETYKCRLFAHLRLSRQNFVTNSFLVVFSLSTTIASLGLIVDRNMYGAGGDALMVALAIISLVTSLVVANANYAARAKAMEISYKEVQNISFRAENLTNDVGNSQMTKREDFLALQSEYLNALRSSENHDDVDHKRWKTGKPQSKALGYVLFVLPALLLVPFVNWYVNGIGLK